MEWYMELLMEGMEGRNGMMVLTEGTKEGSGEGSRGICKRKREEKKTRRRCESEIRKCFDYHK